MDEGTKPGQKNHIAMWGLVLIFVLARRAGAMGRASRLGREESGAFLATSLTVTARNTLRALHPSHFHLHRLQPRCAIDRVNGPLHSISR
ncbi:hypothetical protein BAUCODRAFT_481426 [Baudoinia panamericana UAMH 10762]|uniref:Uncharacterized protein n=1 Tax=Baudoinia panamericana (strain UAMH 10762) TaxID=717646 RepID=M2NBR3_BAUPA|nr:uncharacterized protein BAUCODRAFT_481426 [Baudoinia panamericana UAMH 10762]EMC96589.1 hypothetical protein BAUCODRAFT_481426 [Baudoinia panamericana UAMH 10762]